MKIESCIKVNLEGKYEVLYAGPDRMECRKIFKEWMLKKEQYQSLFQTSGYTSRVMSKAGFQAHAENRAAKSEPKPKKSKKKEEK